MKYLSEEITSKISDIQRRIHQLNDKIVKHEYVLTEEYKLKVNENIKNKKIELEDHEKKCPQAVPEPKIDEKLNSKIEELNTKKESFETSINDIKLENIEVNKKIATLNKIDNRIQNIIVNLIENKNDIDREFSDNKIDIKFNQIFTYKSDTEVLITEKTRAMEANKRRDYRKGRYKRILKVL